MQSRVFRLPILLATLVAVCAGLMPVELSPTQAQPAPTVTVAPDRAAPGETVVITGSGWPPGASVVARLYAAGQVGGPSAVLGAAAEVGSAGTFTLAGTVPHTLFGAGNRGNLEVVPGDYLIHVSAGPEVTATVRLQVSAPPDNLPADPRFFPQTGYRIENDALWEYFQSRGAIDTFGYPVSRTFRLLGFPVQVFQRHVLQVWPDGSVHPLNLLDPGFLPVTTVNFATFPAHDPDVATAAPAPNAPNYGQEVTDYLTQTVPNDWAGQPVGFLRTYLAAAPAVGDYLPLAALEVWGFPTSLPARDPNNASFVYQRFQRGILHFDATTGFTGGILLADAFKSVLTGQPEPRDLMQQVAGSRFHAQYCPGSPNWLCRPDELPDTDLTLAFHPLRPPAGG